MWRVPHNEPKTSKWKMNLKVFFLYSIQWISASQICMHLGWQLRSQCAVHLACAQHCFMLWQIYCNYPDFTLLDNFWMSYSTYIVLMWLWFASVQPWIFPGPYFRTTHGSTFLLYDAMQVSCKLLTVVHGSVVHALVYVPAGILLCSREFIHVLDLLNGDRDILTLSPLIVDVWVQAYR